MFDGIIGRMSGEAKGEVDLEQLKLGRHAILKNAEELVADAEVLYENGRWARSFFLSQTAFEELGKYLMVVSAVAFVTAGKMDWKRFWTRFRNHRAKFFNSYAVLATSKSLEDLLSGDWPLSDERRAEFKEKYLDEVSKASALRDISGLLRMEALYAEFDGSGFYNPSENVSEEYASLFLNMSKMQLD